MHLLLQLFIWIPLVGFFASLISDAKNERLISSIAKATMLLQLAGSITFIAYWLVGSAPTLDSKHIVVFKEGDIEIFIDFYFDNITAVFLLVGSLITFIVTVFSQFYLHRDAGFKRYFSTLLLFFLGYNLIILSGNFETLFLGWELVGICSFLLIAFYRDRYLPVKNSLKAISLYRLGDVCLMLAMWMSHHLWHENITFIKLDNPTLVAEHLIDHNWYAIFIALMFVIAAAIKSAMFPFSSWLPRAMEGPTTSSAIFYGSLSVNIGVFILLRTYPYWEDLMVVKVAVVMIGLVTFLIASSIAKVQSTVKTQIAYATVSQIGLIFIEIALGWHILALVHFAGNAFLRTYQLLVSPSVLGYKIHNMFFNFVPNKTNTSSQSKLSNTIYMLSVKEWNMDFIMYHFMWHPFKWLGKKVSFLTSSVAIVLLSLIFIGGLYSNYFQHNIAAGLFELLPYLFSFIGLLLILQAFAEKGEAIRAWGFIVAGQLFIALSILLLNEDFGHNHILMYLSGTVASAVLGYVCLRKMIALDSNTNLNQFHGYNHRHPKTGFVFLIACLGLVGLPFTPAFIGIDILFNHIYKHEEIIIIFTSLSFLVIEIAILRIYARVFLGMDKKMDHAMAYRSS